MVTKGAGCLGIVYAVHIGAGGLQISLDTSAAAKIAACLSEDEIILDRSEEAITVFLPVLFQMRG